MMDRKRAAMKMMSVALAMLLAGCASFAGNQLAPVRSFPGPQPRKPSANVEIAFHQFLNDEPIELAREAGEKALTKRCIKRFQRSGLFTEVGDNLHSPDLRVSIDLTDRGEGSIGMAILTGLTLYIVPSAAKDTYDLNAVVVDTASGNRWSIHLEDHITQWQQIFLLPLMPFRLTPVVAAKVQNNLFDNLAKRMCEEGCFR